MKFKREDFGTAIDVLRDDFLKESQAQKELCDYLEINDYDIIDESRCLVRESYTDLVGQLIGHDDCEEEILFLWVSDQFRRDEEGFVNFGLRLPCGVETVFFAKDGKDLYDYIKYLKANENDDCALCRAISERRGIDMCMEDDE